MTRSDQATRRLSAKDHQEAYDLWAKHFADPALMANRDAKTTLRKLEHVVAKLPIKRESVVLDVGPGDGTLFRILSETVARCCGVDPSVAAIEKLMNLQADLKNVEFAVGAADTIPYPGGTFDIVVINSVLQMLPSRDDVRRAMRELIRVCKPGGTIFVGELPFRSELAKGIIPHAARKLGEAGAANFLRLIWNIYVRPVLRGEPVLTYPATNLFVPESEFVVHCQELGLTTEVMRHQELRHPSATRNDYLLRVPRRSDAVIKSPSPS
jgi:ubiquinone/menaquinone biosynthesis C-methylase UbiE